MFRGLYTVTSAMQTNQKKLDVVTNNMANASTTGFKKDVVISEAFPEMLISKINGKLESSPDGKTLNVQVQADGRGYNVTTTKGFFVVDSPMGKSYSKSARFAVDQEGYLKTYTRDINREVDTTTGFYVLDKEGNRVQVPNPNITIDPSGQVVSGGQVVANLIYNTPKNVIGTINGGLRFDRIQTNFLGGGLGQTDNKLDFALKGDGFFKIQTPEGIRYTRDGSFLTDSKGQLVTAEGYQVLGKNGPIILNPDFNINTKGEISVGNEYVDQINVVNVLNVNGLRKQGQNLYKIEENMNPQEEAFAGEILQGFVENSNVNTVNEMVDMINILREYESSQKVIRSYDEMLGKAVNEIGKV